jgi:hypothetical protein
METNDFTIDCTGDVVVGDTICYTEPVWTGFPKNPKRLGERTIMAEIIKDSYGEKKQQHTFTIEVIRSFGVNPLEVGRRTTRKGRNIYKNGTQRLAWKCHEARSLALNEKHNRGSVARQARDIRKNC